MITEKGPGESARGVIPPYNSVLPLKLLWLQAITLKISLEELINVIVVTIILL